MEILEDRCVLAVTIDISLVRLLDANYFSFPETSPFYAILMRYVLRSCWLKVRWAYTKHNGIRWSSVMVHVINLCGAEDYRNMRDRRQDSSLTIRPGVFVSNVRNNARVRRNYRDWLLERLISLGGIVYHWCRCAHPPFVLWSKGGNSCSLIGR